jgi:HAE1 family hydrophobic/amphiphilic exporter-1
MAIAVIGGVAVSTLLTLFVVPCVYALLSKFERSHSAGMIREKEITQATRDAT